MSLIDLRPMWSAEESSLESDGKTSSRSSSRSWSAIGSDPAFDTVDSILAESRIALGQSLTSDVFRRIRSLRCVRISPIYFRIDAGFFAEGGKSNDENNPLNQRAIIEYDFVDHDEEIDCDINGNPIATDNGEGYTGVTEPFSDLVILWQKNLPAFDPLLAKYYKNSTNADTFLGFPPGVCRFVGVRAREVEDAGFVYFQANAAIEVREPILSETGNLRAWWKRLRHEGFMEREPGGAGAIRHAVELNEDGGHNWGEKVSKPVMLKPGGERELDKTKAHWKYFQTKKSLPFSGILQL